MSNGVELKSATKLHTLKIVEQHSEFEGSISTKSEVSGESFGQLNGQNDFMSLSSGIVEEGFTHEIAMKLAETTTTSLALQIR